MSFIDTNQIATFQKSIVISNSEFSQSAEPLGEATGQIRFNKTTNRFEGYHNVAGRDVFGNYWRTFTIDVASSSNLGGIKVGSNLLINPSTGVLSSIASGSGRSLQLVITISPIDGAADFTNINDAIEQDIGTPGGSYTDGAITTIIGSAPSAEFPFILLLAPGLHSYSDDAITLPPFVSIFSETGATLQFSNLSIDSAITLSSNCIIINSDIEIGSGMTGNVAIINSSNTSNIKLSNLTFSDTAHNTTCNLSLINLASMNSTTEIHDITADITHNYNILHGIYTDSSYSKLDNCNITFTTYSNIAYGIYHSYALIGSTATTISDINSSSITIHDRNPNYPVYLSNSYVTFRDVQIYSNSTVALYINNPTYYIQYPDAWDTYSVIHNTDGYNDLLLSSDTGFRDLSIFTPNQMVKITDNATSAGISNNCYALVLSATADTLTLQNCHSLTSTSQSSGYSIALDQLFQVVLTDCTLNGLINPLISVGNTYINMIDCKLISGGVAEIDGSILNTISPLKVSMDDVTTPFHVISDALDYIAAIPNIANCNRHQQSILIDVAAGIYQEFAPLILQPYCTIKGAGMHNTYIRYSHMIDATAAVTLNHDCRISDITIANNTADSAGIPNSNTFTMLSANACSNIIIDSVSLANYGNSNTVILCNITDCDAGVVLRDVNMTISNSSIANAYAIYNNNSNISTENVTISSMNATTSYGYYLLHSAVDPTYQYNTNLRITAGDGYGLYLDNNITDDIYFDMAGGALTAATYNVYIPPNDNVTLHMQGVNFNSDIASYSANAVILCNDCFYAVGGTYIPLNHFGQREYDVGTLTIGDYAGTASYSGSNNTIIGVGLARGMVSASGNTLIGGGGIAVSATLLNRNTVIGNGSAVSMTTSNLNTICGANSAVSLNCGNSNIIYGVSSGNGLTWGESNLIVGNNTANAVGVSARNIIIGSNTATTLNTSDNIICGFGTFRNSTSNNAMILGSNTAGNAAADNMLIIGNNSGNGCVSADITGIGNAAMRNCSGGRTTAYGYGVLGNNAVQSSGIGNTVYGNMVGYNMGVAEMNTVIGDGIGYNITSGSRNIIVAAGGSAASAIVGGNDNALYGFSCAAGLTSGEFNVIAGSNTAGAITSSSRNVLIGANCASSLITNGQSVVVGHNAAQSHAVGYGVFVGANSGRFATGNGATCIGYNTAVNSTGINNTVSGFNAMGGAGGGGSYNTVYGAYVGYSLSSGSRNTLIGSGDSSESTGRQISSGSDNCIVGFKGGRYIQTASDNSIYGSNAAASLTTGIGNLVLAANAGYSLNTSNYNIILGDHSGYNTDSSAHIHIGYYSAYNQISGEGMLNIGYMSGYSAVSASHGINIGYMSGYSNLISENVYIGYQCGGQATTAERMICCGSYAGYGDNANDRNIGADSIFIGNNCGRANETGLKNTYCGSNVGRDGTDISKSVMLGYQAGMSASAGNNIFIGTVDEDSKGVGWQTSAARNVFIGSNVAVNNIGGGEGIFIGFNAARMNVHASRNIAIGSSASEYISGNAATDTISIGTNTAKLNVYGASSIAIGKNAAGLCGTNICDVIAIGESAAKEITSNAGIFIGKRSGMATTSALDCICIGESAGEDNEVSCGNTLIGAHSGASMKGSGVSGGNTMLGAYAGEDTNSGIFNIFIGSNCAMNNVSGSRSVIIGADGMKTGEASSVVIIGYESAIGNQADSIICIGKSSSKNNISGESVISIGADSNYTSISSSNVIAIGNRSAYSGNNQDSINIGAETGYFASNSSINIGHQAGYNNIGGIGQNILCGFQSGYGQSNSLAYTNIGIGYKSLYGIDAGYRNIAIGGNCAISLSNGHTNSIFGYNAALSLHNGYKNIIYGETAANGLYDGFECVFIGTSSGFSAANCSGCICVGNFSGLNMANSTNNLFLGNFAGQGDSGGILGSNNIGIGNFTLNKISDAQFNCAIGSLAGFNLLEGDNNLLQGYRSGYSLTSGWSNTLYGMNSGSNLTTSYRNIAIGTDTLLTATIDIQDAICIGTYAGKLTTSGYILNIGSNAGAKQTTSTYNVNIGHESCSFNETGSFSVNIGPLSGLYSTSSFNTYIGSYAGAGLAMGTNTGSFNIGMGYNSLGWVKSASYTIALGVSSCFNLDSGMNNIALGSNVCYNLSSGSNNLVISSQNGGYNLTTANANIILGGNTAGSLISGDRNVFIGESCCAIGGTSDFGNLYFGQLNNSGNCNILLSANGSLTPTNYTDRFVITSSANTTPLLYGDLADNILYINSTSNVTSELSTKLIVNGRAYALSFSPFTGEHRIIIPNFANLNLKFGMILSAVRCLGKADPLNPIIEVEISNIEKDKRVYCVYTDTEKINGIEYHYGAALGEGSMLICNKTGENLESGDYIMSSGINGYGMKQDSDLMHSYTVGKALEPVNWDDVTDYIENGLIKVALIACSYHCG